MNFKIKTMNTKQKVQYWLEKYSHLKDNDNALCANIWNDEIKKYIEMKKSSVKDFLRLYSLGQLTSAPSIKRARAKLQEENPSLRGEKYYLRKGTLQDKVRKELGYEINK